MLEPPLSPHVARFGTCDLEGKSGALGACDVTGFPRMQEGIEDARLDAWSFGKPAISC